MKRFVLVAVAAMLFIPVVELWAAETPWETIEWGKMDPVQKFQWGVDLFQMGRTQDAAGVIGKVLAGTPEPKQLMAMDDYVSDAVRARMLADKDASTAIQDFAKAVEGAAVKLRTDEAYLTDVAAKLMGQGPERALATRRLRQMGEFAAPPVIKLAAQTEKTDVRVTCRVVLLDLGRKAVLPALECLSAPDSTLKLMLLDVLGELKDERALARISQMVASKDEPADVRQAAMNALSRIMFKVRPALEVDPDPAVNYWRVGDAYLHSVAFTWPTMEGDGLPVWTWSAEKKWVVYRMVATKLYNEKLGEEACYDGLAVAKDEKSARNSLALRSLVIACYFSEKLDLLGTETPELNRALDMAVMVGGQKALMQCLEKAIADKDAGIAIQAAHALEASGAGKGFTDLERIKKANPLLMALENPDRAVRFAAARAVVAWQPGSQRPDAASAAGKATTARFDNYERVLPALSWGLMSELPDRTVLVIHPDTAVINYYQAEAKKLGHAVLCATDLKGGLALCSALPTPDVVLLASTYAGDVAKVKAALGTGRVAVVLVAPVAEKEAIELKYVKTGAAATAFYDLAGADNIKLVFGTALAPPEAKEVKDLVANISQKAAESMAAIVPGCTPMPLKTLEPALRRALASTNDAVRIPVLVTLGNIGAESPVLDVLAVAADTKSKKEVRLAALRTLSQMLELEKIVPPDVFSKLVPVSAEADNDIAMAAARAIAAAKFDPAQFTDLMVLKRVQEIKAGG